MCPNSEDAKVVLKWFEELFRRLSAIENKIEVLADLYEELVCQPSLLDPNVFDDWEDEYPKELYVA